MTGLDRIIEKIKSDSADTCSQIISDAQKNAQDILAKAEDECKTILEQARIEDNLAEEKAIELASSAAGQRTRQNRLSCKVKAINEVIEESLFALEHLPAGEYFGALIRLIETHAQAGSCKLLLNVEDIARKPDDFNAAAIAAAKKNGCELTVDDIGSPIAPGLVLKYGDIEIDCTFRSLIDEKREEIKEKVNELLF